MAQIDPNIHNPLSYTAPGGLSREQHQSWLQSLESAGWKQILETMGKFSGAVDLAVPTDTTSVLKDASKQVASLQAESQPFKQLQQAAVQDTEGEASKQNHQFTVQNARDCSAYAIALASRQIDGTDAEIQGPHFMRRIQFGLENSPVSARKLLVLPTGEKGVEVWIRDADITGARMQMLLADVRRNAQSHGNELVKVSVNGREVFSERSERVKSTEGKGG